MDFLKIALGLVGKFAQNTTKAVSPNQVGSRRAKTSLAAFYVGIAFVITAHFLGISDTLVLSVMALGGVPVTAFVVGESMADARGRSANGKN